MFFSSREELQLRTLPTSSAFVHVTLGGGLPLAAHDRVTSLVSFSVLLLEIADVIEGRARIRKKQKKNTQIMGKY